MKYLEKETLFNEFQNKWGLQFKNIPFILKYITSYPHIIRRLDVFNMLNIDELKNSQFEWVALVAQFDNPIESSFFKSYWVPIEKNGYDYFIDLSFDALPLFKVYYSSSEPHHWCKKHIFKDLSQFLINIDNRKFNTEKYFNNLDDESCSKAADFFNGRDDLSLRPNPKPDIYNIKLFACQHFFDWENGEDFIWLVKEWSKFQPHLKNVTEAENFILVLSNVYYYFKSEAYFLKDSDFGNIYPPNIEKINEQFNDIEISTRVSNFYDQALGILLEAYIHPGEILRQLVSIAIDYELPHQDAYTYIYKLFSGRYKEDDFS